MTDEVCNNCGHSEEDHPHHFMCYAEVETPNHFRTVGDCRCPGWVKRVEGINDK